MAATARPENTVSDIGIQLAQHSRPSKDFLVKSLRQAEGALSELDQLPTLKPFLRPLSQFLAKHGLLHHKDKDVKVLVASCFCEIIRILAPEPSFDDKTFKGIFELFIGMFMELADTTSYFSRRVKILETVATLECCRRMLDLDCDDLILKMFKVFFSVVREEHQRNLISAMLSIMSLILNEEETVQPLLEVVLRNLRNKGKDHPPASYHLAAALIQNCAEKIQPAICEFLTSCILDRDSVRSELKECYHDVIFEIFQCAPHMLLAVIPNLAQELLIDQVDVRIKSVNLIGRLLSLPKAHDIYEHHFLFVELLKRFSDKSTEVRISVIRAVKSCYMADPSGIESHEILSAIEGRLLDFDASVRMEAVSVICDLARLSLKNFPEALITHVTDRLRDKMALVRKETLRKLLEVYHEYCTKCYEEQMTLSECYERIPCKMLILSFDKNLKEFRPQNLELLLGRDLFPATLPVEDRTRHWICLYSLFTPAHVKALHLVLSQKRRFQKEMKDYLSIRRKEKGVDAEEANSSIKHAFARMSAAFPNPVKVEESLYKLDKLKDIAIFDLLLQLLGEPEQLNTDVLTSNFLEKIGKKDPLVEFMEAIALKCSHNIFSADHVRYIVEHVSTSSSRNDHVDESSFNLLSDIVGSFPLLLRGSERAFQMLILEEDSPLCGKLVHILAKVGPWISMELSEIYPFLERLCLEGTRTQSKAAVSAMEALAGPSEQFLVMNLCQKLVKSLHAGWNVPTVLQSLGCISQHFVSELQKQDNEILSYIRERIFKAKLTEDGAQSDEKPASAVSFDGRMKIYGLKTLVKSALPKKEVCVGEKLNSLLDTLSKVLHSGEFSSMACETDMAHIKLVAAKSVLRLSRRWDLHISPQLFHSTVMMAKDASPFARKGFLDKTHKLLKEHAASVKFACGFALAASDSVKDLQNASFKYLVDFSKEYGRAVACPSDKERSLTDGPAYVVVFLLHVLTHDPEFPPLDAHSEELFVKFCRPLVLILQVLVSSTFVDADLDVLQKNMLCLQSLFRAIKKAEDAIDPEKTPKLHMLANIGISIVNALKHEVVDLLRAPGLVLLPSTLYKTMTKKTKEGDSCPIGFIFNENFVRKLIHNFEQDFSQFSRKSVKPGRKCLKDSVQDHNIVDLSVSNQVDILKDGTTQDKGAGKEASKIHIPEVCPKGKQQNASAPYSIGTVQLQDNSSVIEEHEADGSGNFDNLQIKEHQVDPKSAALELFGSVSNVSSQELDVSLPVAQQDERKRKSSSEPEGSLELSKTNHGHDCSSNGSTVSHLHKCDTIRKKHCFGDGAKEVVTGSRKGAAEKQGKGDRKRKILLDKTNSLAVSSLQSQKHCELRKTFQGRQIVADTPASDVSDVSKDAIAFRTRRRKV